jgi:MFS family permease
MKIGRFSWLPSSPFIFAVCIAGLALALRRAWTPAVLFGLGLVGIGLSVPFPLVLSAAGRLAKWDRRSTLATVTTWGYFGMIVGPPCDWFYR